MSNTETLEFQKSISVLQSFFSGPYSKQELNELEIETEENGQENPQEFFLLYSIYDNSERTLVYVIADFIEDFLETKLQNQDDKIISITKEEMKKNIDFLYSLIDR